MSTALGLQLQAVAQPAGIPEPSGALAAFAAPPTMGPAVPGQRIDVRVALTNRGTTDIEPTDMTLIAGADWRVEKNATAPARLGYNQTARQSFGVTVPEAAALTRPYFERQSIAESRYAIRGNRKTINAEHADAAESGFLCAFCGFCVERCDPMYRPAAEPALSARARYTVAGVPVDIRSTVRRREPHLPYGDELR